MEIAQHAPVCSEKKERYTNLELLRILATLFVVMLHYNNPSSGKAFLYTEAMPLHYQILLFFEVLAICAVNLFVMISGYFLCCSTRVRIWKILRLFIDVIFFSMLRYLLPCLLGKAAFTLRGFWVRLIPLNWYVAVYAGLYLISPYLNQILQNKSRSQFHFMLLIFFFVLSVWPAGIEFLSNVTGAFSPNALCPIGNQGSGDGYTLVNFILMYFLGAYCRVHENEMRSVKKGICAMAVYLVCAIPNALYANFFFYRAIAYCNPLVIIQTVALFVAFQNISIQSKAINAIAGCSFGVYLMHSFFFPYCQIERFVTGNPLVIPIHISASAVLIYAACALIYWGYQKAFSPVFALLQKKLSFLSYDVRSEEPLSK